VPALRNDAQRDLTRWFRDDLLPRLPTLTAGRLAPARAGRSRAGTGPPPGARAPMIRRRGY
jgi:hypothetical protein